MASRTCNAPKSHVVPEEVRSDVEAVVKYVVEAMMVVSLSQSAVVVAWVVVPAYERPVVKGHAPLPVGHAVRQSAERQIEVAESCVVEAYESCEAFVVPER